MFGYKHCFQKKKKKKAEACLHWLIANSTEVWAEEKRN